MRYPARVVLLWCAHISECDPASRRLTELTSRCFILLTDDESNPLNLSLNILPPTHHQHRHFQVTLGAQTHFLRNYAADCKIVRAMSVPQPWSMITNDPAAKPGTPSWGNCANRAALCLLDLLRRPDAFHSLLRWRGRKPQENRRAQSSARPRTASTRRTIPLDTPLTCSTSRCDCRQQALCPQRTLSTMRGSRRESSSSSWTCKRPPRRTTSTRSPPGGSLRRFRSLHSM